MLVVTLLLCSSRKVGIALTRATSVNVGVQTARHAHKDEITHTRPPTQWLWHQKCGGMGVHQGETNDRKDILKLLLRTIRRRPGLQRCAGLYRGWPGVLGGGPRGENKESDNGRSGR